MNDRAWQWLNRAGDIHPFRLPLDPDRCQVRHRCIAYQLISRLPHSGNNPSGINPVSTVRVVRLQSPYDLLHNLSMSHTQYGAISHEDPSQVPLITYLWVCGLSLLSAIAGYLDATVGAGKPRCLIDERPREVGLHRVFRQLRSTSKLLYWQRRRIRVVYWGPLRRVGKLLALGTGQRRAILTQLSPRAIGASRPR